MPVPPGRQSPPVSFHVCSQCSAPPDPALGYVWSWLAGFWRQWLWLPRALSAGLLGSGPDLPSVRGLHLR